MTVEASIPTFCQGIQSFGQPLPDFDRYGKEAVITEKIPRSPLPVTLMRFIRPFWPLMPCVISPYKPLPANNQAILVVLRVLLMRSRLW